MLLIWGFSLLVIISNSSKSPLIGLVFADRPPWLPPGLEWSVLGDQGSLASFVGGTGDALQGSFATVNKKRKLHNHIHKGSSKT